MFCKRWRPEELLPKVDLLTFLLMLNPHVTGVALTGSLARKERRIHDIDLVVLHDGELEDGSAQDPEREEPYYNNDLILSSVFAATDGPELLSRSLSQARDNIPVNYIFVSEKALWDCGYLARLEREENFPGFYKRVFCDTPLLLLHPYHVRGKLLERIDSRQIVAFESGLFWNGFSYPVLPIQHKCGEIAFLSCQPAQTWAECRKEIKRRKNHWWHPFMDLIGR